MILDEMRLEVVPGDGVVARIGGCVLFVTAATSEERTRQLLDIVLGAEGDQMPGRQVARSLAAWLAALGPDAAPAFGAVAEADQGLAVVLHGPVRLRATGAGLDVDLDGSNRPTWVDDYVSGDATEVTLAASGTEPDSRPMPFDLTRGVVPGAGCVLVSRSLREATAVPDVAEPGLAADASDDAPPAVMVETSAEVEESVGDQTGGAVSDVDTLPFEVIDLAADGEFSFTPLPLAGGRGDQPDVIDVDLVEGKACGRGHFNDLAARYCALCGIGMVQVTEQIVLGKRPPLGILVFEDGMTYSLDSDYVIGREPEGDATVQDGDARPIEISDSDIISRIHARISLAGWEVGLQDEGSANGTFMRDGEQWRRLTPGTQEALVSGSEVRLGVEDGARFFTFDSHHRAR